jgi:hypothetical protein
VSATGPFFIEECVFDMNGYKEDPFDPSTWTAEPKSSRLVNQLPLGTGVQPTRTVYDRNMYLSSYSALYLRGNIISRGGGGGSVQMRVGGIAERNALLFNNAAMSTGHPQANRSLLQDAVLQSNLVLHDDHMLPPGGFGHGIGLGVGEQNQGIASDNVVAHFHRRGSKGRSFSVAGIGAHEESNRPGQRALSVTLTGNVGVDDFNPGILLASAVSEDGIQSAVIGDNAIAVASRDAVVGEDLARDAAVEFGTIASGGNDYFAPTWDLAAWQARGYDPESTRHPTVEALAAAKGWMSTPDAQGCLGWERDIVSYMQSIDPTYIPNEDVTVDDGVPLNKRRPNAHKVWHIMRISWPSNNGPRSNTGSNNHVIDENHPSGPSRWILSGPNGPIALMKLVSFHRINGVVQPGVIGRVVVEQWYDYDFWSAVPATGSSYSFQYAPGSPGSGALYRLPGRETSDNSAKLIARRYHAFLAFIERAKANRKGAFDVRYTADALNNYIREGFGKSRVSGPYTANYP